MDSCENSLLVLLNEEEYCFLYDDYSIPELLESLLGYGDSPDTERPGNLHVGHSREIARGLIGRMYQEI